MKGAAKKGDDEYADYSFKEGNTHTLKMKDIFIKEKGKAALADFEKAATAQPAKVKGGAKGKKKAVSKAKVEKKSLSVKKQTGKILKYTPSKVSVKKSAKKRTPAMPSPGGKQSARTTDQMTMAQFKKYLDWHEKKKVGKLGKRSAGKASASSQKSKKK